MRSVLIVSAVLAAGLAFTGEVQATSCPIPIPASGGCLSNPPVPPKLRIFERFNKPPILRYFQPRYWWRGVP